MKLVRVNNCWTSVDRYRESELVAYTSYHTEEKELLVLHRKLAHTKLRPFDKVSQRLQEKLNCTKIFRFDDSFFGKYDAQKRFLFYFHKPRQIEALLIFCLSSFNESFTKKLIFGSKSFN